MTKEQELYSAGMLMEEQELELAGLQTGNQSPGHQNRSGFRQDLVAKTSRWAVAKNSSCAAA